MRPQATRYTPEAWAALLLRHIPDATLTPDLSPTDPEHTRVKDLSLETLSDLVWIECDYIARGRR